MGDAVDVDEGDARSESASIVAVADGAVAVRDLPMPSGLAAMTPFRVASPPIVRTLARRPTPVRSARLRRISSRANRVTDVQFWFATNQLIDTTSIDIFRSSPEFDLLQGPVMGQHLTRAFDQDGSWVLVYAASAQNRNGPLLAVVEDDGTVRAFFDFREWTGPVGTHPMHPEFARVVGDVLYVSHMHRTYAATTNGLNAYLSAIDVSTGALIWRSGPLEANVRAFAIVDDVIVTGYGFTGEKDYLFVLDRRTGRRLHRVRLETGPRFILEREGRIYVRAYDRDYVYALRVQTR